MSAKKVMTTNDSSVRPDWRWGSTRESHSLDSHFEGMNIRKRELECSACSSSQNSISWRVIPSRPDQEEQGMLDILSLHWLRLSSFLLQSNPVFLFFSESKSVFCRCSLCKWSPRGFNHYWKDFSIDLYDVYFVSTFFCGHYLTDLVLESTSLYGIPNTEIHEVKAEVMSFTKKGAVFSFSRFFLQILPTDSSCRNLFSIERPQSLSKWENEKTAFHYAVSWVLLLYHLTHRRTLKRKRTESSREKPRDMMNLFWSCFCSIKSRSLSPFSCITTFFSLLVTGVNLTLFLDILTIIPFHTIEWLKQTLIMREREEMIKRRGSEGNGFTVILPLVFFQSWRESIPDLFSERTCLVSQWWWDSRRLKKDTHALPMMKLSVSLNQRECVCIHGKSGFPRLLEKTTRTK